MNFDRKQFIDAPGELQQELTSLFDTRAPLVLFEIGACEGEDSVKYSRLFPAASIFAFEPLPDNVKLVNENFERYQVKNVSCYNIALSSENGTADFYVSEGKPEDAPEADWDHGNKSSSLLAPEKHLETASFIHFKKKITVQTVTLETFCKEHHVDHIDFIHMDVQGAELMVLKGAGNFIGNIKAIWLEVAKVDLYKDQPLVGDVKKFMHDNGFALVKNALHGIQGDHLYISTKYFSSSRIFYLRWLFAAMSFKKRVFRKLGLSR